MNYGFVKVAAGTPKIKVADCEYNARNIIQVVKDASLKGAKLLVLPELCITGYTCSDLFYQETLLNGAVGALFQILEQTESIEVLTFVGMPIRKNNKLYNVAVAIFKGKILGVIPKTHLPNYNEFYEKRQFASADEYNSSISINGNEYPFGTKLIFRASSMNEFTVAAEICEDLWVVSPPSSEHALAGANIIVNLSASNELIGKAEYRRKLIEMQSARLVSGYVYADIGDGESTTDLVYAGHNLIAENGKMLAETTLFKNDMITAEIDVRMLNHERSKIMNYNGKDSDKYIWIPFNIELTKTELNRTYNRMPFVPTDTAELDKRTELTLNLQVHGLAKRIEHTNTKFAVIGISGGLDSCLALLVAVRAMELLGRPHRDVLGITMPCFGTTSRTLSNSHKLSNLLGISFREIAIGESVTKHLIDIGHNGELNIAYENAQARERTQVLMDIANCESGIVIGTGDLSELALGWATYNGDHMSMYGVNSSVPKTLVKHLISYEASRSEDALKNVLEDIIATPISPELLPPKNGEIQQITEDTVGPYILHDFFLYYIVRMGFEPSKVFYIATRTFSNEYDPATIKKWLKIFVSRFFSQQFKRSCMPDGVKIGSLSLSPRGDWRMPSDASAKLWQQELDNIDA